VTGHAFSNGCVDEMTWYLEDKSIWAAAMAMSLAMLHVSILLTLISSSSSYRSIITCFAGYQCSFGNDSYAGIEEGRESHVS
jgi:hypothetical protein